MEFTLETACALARQAGTIHRAHWSPYGVPFDRKDDLTPVTAADRAIEQMVIEEWRTKWARSISLVTEESGTHVVPGSRRKLIVDEIDGTLPFRLGMVGSTCMFALCEDDQVVLSAIYEPIGDTMFTAERGKGAHLNGRRIHVSEATSVRGETIVLETTPRTPPHLQLDPQIHASGGNAMRLYSLGFLFTRVAMGGAAGLIWPGTKPHDGCPGALLLQEAGAVVTDMAGQPFVVDDQLNGIIAAATPELHAELLVLVRECDQAD